MVIGLIAFVVIRDAIFRDLSTDTFAGLLIVGLVLAGYMVRHRCIPRRPQPGREVLAELEADDLRVYVDAFTHVTMNLKNVDEVQILTSEEDNAIRLVKMDGCAFRSYVASREELSQVADFANSHLGGRASWGL